MLKALVVSRFYTLAAAFDNRAAGKKQRKVPTVIAYTAILLTVVGFFALVGYLFYGLCEAVKGTGDEAAVLVFPIMSAISLCIVGSTFATQTQIFDARDNDLVLSLPVPTRLILLSRMIALSLINLVLESVVLLPCLVIYGIVIGYTPLGFLFTVLVLALVPFLSLAVSVFVAWIVSEISSRVKNKTLVKMIIFLAFLAAYMYFCFSGAIFAGASIPLFWWPAEAIANGDGLGFLYFTLCAVLPFALVYAILNKCFLRIITTKKTGAKTSYKGNRAKSASARIALLKKEMARFFSSAAYMMNTAIGALMCLIISIFVAINSGDILMSFNMPGNSMPDGILPVLMCGACMLFCSVSYVSAPSISLEDRSLWILQVSPVNAKDILMAKLNFHMLICMPLYFVSALIACIALELNVGMSLLVILTALSAVAFTGYFGLLLGLHFPKFGWQNENSVIKQGVPVLGTMLGSMALFTGLWVLSLFCIEISGYFAVAVILLPILLLCGIIHVYLVSHGVKVFEKLKK